MLCTGSSRQQSVNHTYKPPSSSPSAVAPVATWTQVDVKNWLSSAVQLSQHADRLTLPLPHCIQLVSKRYV